MKDTLTIPYIKDFSFNGEIPAQACHKAVASHNWATEYPYAPEVSASLWHDGNRLYISYDVKEDDIAALASKDNNWVHTDSCVEFFVAFDNDGYYNIESNCIGTVLMSHRKDRKTDVNYASEEVLNSIERKPSLGKETFATRKADGRWQLTLSIPADAFFKHDISSFNGVRCKANIYKCGDNLPKPHFMSWQPVGTPSPDFHRPEYFGEVLFED